MVWEYHSDRAKNSVESILKKFKGNGELHVIFSGDPKSYEIDNIIRPNKVLIDQKAVLEDGKKCVEL